MTDVKSRLEYLRGEIEAERISMGELVELQGYANDIDPDDVVLLEAAGVPEHIEDDDNATRHVNAGHDVTVTWVLYASSDVSADYKVKMKPDFLGDADNWPEVYCRSCEAEVEWTKEMEWV